jgi:hypothetical protein
LLSRFGNATAAIGDALPFSDSTSAFRLPGASVTTEADVNVQLYDLPPYDFNEQELQVYNAAVEVITRYAPAHHPRWRQANAAHVAAPLLPSRGNTLAHL